MMAHPILAVIGAGGKTTALRALARSLSGRRVLLTTTTHIQPIAPPETRALLIDPDEAALRDALAAPGAVCAGSAADDGKLGALAPGLFRAAAQAAEVTLCEADGAHHRPLKLHRPDEPVVPPGTARCLIVAGLSAWGRPVGEAVHRYDRRPDWAHDPQRPVGAAEVLYCVREAARASGLPQDRLRVWLNQADTAALRAQAAPVARILSAEGLDCRAGSLRSEPDGFARWFLSDLAGI